MLVIVWAGGISDAPLGHGAGGIACGCLLEAADGFIVVIAITPEKPAIEPDLCFVGVGCYWAGVVAEIIIVGHGGYHPRLEICPLTYHGRHLKENRPRVRGLQLMEISCLVTRSVRLLWLDKAFDGYSHAGWQDQG